MQMFLISGSHSRFLLGFTGFAPELWLSDIFRDSPDSRVSPLRRSLLKPLLKTGSWLMIPLIADSVHIIGHITRPCERSLPVMCLEDPPRCQRISYPSVVGGIGIHAHQMSVHSGATGPRSYGPDAEPEKTGGERTDRRVPG